MSGEHSAKTPRPPLECTWCGMPRWNDETVEWLHSYGDRRPYCADGCAAQAIRMGEAS